MPSMDRELLYEFFANCRELGLETPEIEQVGPASDGRIPEYAEEFGETEVEHRHVSHLYCIYPARIPASNELNLAAEKSLLKRGRLVGKFAYGHALKTVKMHIGL